MEPELVPTAPVEASPEARALAKDLAGLIGEEGISLRWEDREAKARDLWPKALLWFQQGLIPAPPDLVVRPKDIQDIRKLIDFARPRGIPVTPYGAGSGVCGGAIPLSGGISLDLRSLDTIRRIDPEALEVEAEAGVLGSELEATLEAQGLTLGHFPSSIGMSSVGGWLAARSAGQSSSRYGKIEDMVQELGCVLGTGEVVRPRRPARGVDWIELLVGSEGTLGVITDARLRLHPAPEAQIARGFRFRSVTQGIAAMRDLFQSGLRPSVVRLYDPFDSLLALGHREGAQVPIPGRRELLTAREKGEQPHGSLRHTALLRTLERSGAVNRVIGLPRSCLLVVVHEGDREAAQAEAMQTRAICVGNHGTDLGEGPGRRWLRKRWAVSYKMPRMFDAGAWVDTLEVAADWGRIETLYRSVREAVAPHALAMAHFSHAYADGCSIYFTFSGAATPVERGLQSYEETWRAALTAVDGNDATITHHHGVGLLKTPWLAKELGAGGLALLRALKRVCDPAGIMNPGKLVP